MISKENKKKLICLSGMCEHSVEDKNCLFLKYVDKGPESLLTLFEKVINEEIKNGLAKKSSRK